MTFLRQGFIVLPCVYLASYSSHQLRSRMTRIVSPYETVAYVDTRDPICVVILDLSVGRSHPVGCPRFENNGTNVENGEELAHRR